MDWDRQTVGVEATGPVTGARCRSPWKSLIASPPGSGATARSIASWPRPWTEANSRGALRSRKRVLVENEGVAADFLTCLGIGLEEARRRVLAAIAATPEPPPPAMIPRSQSTIARANAWAREIAAARLGC